jgi:hypothetical protein
LAEKVTESPSPWERWPDEVGGYSGERFYPHLPWAEWIADGGTWAATKGEDFTEVWQFTEELESQAREAGKGVDIIGWNWELVFFRFYDPEERASQNPERSAHV